MLKYIRNKTVRILGVIAVLVLIGLGFKAGQWQGIGHGFLGFNLPRGVPILIPDTTAAERAPYAEKTPSISHRILYERPLGGTDQPAKWEPWIADIWKVTYVEKKGDRLIFQITRDEEIRERTVDNVPRNFKLWGTEATPGYILEYSRLQFNWFHYTGVEVGARVYLDRTTRPYAQTGIQIRGGTIYLGLDNYGPYLEGKYRILF